MKHHSLPYDMGNAGDMIKHGLLAEYVEWWCIHHKKGINFVDPFGGKKWVEPAVLQVVKRMQTLGSCALSRAQREPAQRYYGSGHLVKNSAVVSGETATVHVSDQNPEAVKNLVDSGLTEFSCPDFNAKDGFSILNTDIAADLILLDPYAKFLRDDAEKWIPKIATYAQRVPIVLFVLNMNPLNKVGKRFEELRSLHFGTALSLCCPKIVESRVRGESKYESEVILIIPKGSAQSYRKNLEERLKVFAKLASRALGTYVVFHAGKRG